MHLHMHIYVICIIYVPGGREHMHMHMHISMYRWSRSMRAPRRSQRSAPRPPRKRWHLAAGTYNAPCWQRRATLHPPPLVPGVDTPGSGRRAALGRSGQFGYSLVGGRGRGSRLGRGYGCCAAQYPAPLSKGTCTCTCTCFHAQVPLSQGVVHAYMCRCLSPRVLSSTRRRYTWAWRCNLKAASPVTPRRRAEIDERPDCISAALRSELRLHIRRVEPSTERAGRASSYSLRPYRGSLKADEG